MSACHAAARAHVNQGQGPNYKPVTTKVRQCGAVFCGVLQKESTSEKELPQLLLCSWVAKAMQVLSQVIVEDVELT